MKVCDREEKEKSERARQEQQQEQEEEKQREMRTRKRRTRTRMRVGEMVGSKSLCEGGEGECYYCWVLDNIRFFLRIDQRERKRGEESGSVRKEKEVQDGRRGRGGGKGKG